MSLRRIASREWKEGEKKIDWKRRSSDEDEI